MNFPIIALLRQALRTIGHQPDQWLRAFWPVLLLGAGPHLISSPAWGITLTLAAIPIHLSCGCAWLRHVLTGQTARLRLGRAEWRAFKTCFFAGFVFALIMMPGTALIDIVPIRPSLLVALILLLGSVMGLWVTALLFLPLPANAIGSDLSSVDIHCLLGRQKTPFAVAISAFLFMGAALEALLLQAGAWSAPLICILQGITQALTLSVLALSFLWLRTQRDQTILPSEKIPSVPS